MASDTLANASEVSQSNQTQMEPGGILAPSITDIAALEDIQGDVLSKNQVVYFYSNSSATPRECSTVFESAATSPKFRETAFRRVDCDKHKGIVESLGINQLPWVIGFSRGRRFDEINIGLNWSGFETWLDEYIALSSKYKIPPTIEITSLTELDAMVLRHVNVVVYFHAHWCPFCKSMSPIFESIAASGKFQDIVFCKVDYDRQKDVVAKMEITHVPEAVIFSHGNVVVKLQLGYMPAHLFENTLRHHLTDPGTDGRNTPQFDPPPSEHEELELDSDQDPAYLSSFPVCTGYQPAKGKRSKRVPDPERNCVHTPASEDNHLRIGKASDGLSDFVITLWNDPRYPREINFDVAFMPDPTARCRFESATVSFTFATYVHEKRVPLKIRDISPINANRTPTVRRNDVEGPEGPSDESSIFSSVDGGSDSEDVMIPGATHVLGHGVGTSTALWTFEEDKTLVDLRGLIANQELSVNLPNARTICITFWGKAVLESRNRLGWKSKSTLEIGSAKAPYERIVVLTKLGQAEGV